MPAKGAGGSHDPNQPTQRAMHFIKNKNNISDMRLRQTLVQYDREKASSMYNIDHARLDVKDFLRDVRYCASDQLPESKLWLGDRDETKKKKGEVSRNVFTAPAHTTGSMAGASTGQRDIKTAPDGHSQPGGGKKGDEMVKFGIFMAKKTDIDPNKVHQDIYSRRNMYSTIDRDLKNEEKLEDERKKEEQQQKWVEEQEKAAKEEEERKAKERKIMEDKLRKEREEERQRQIEEKRAAMLLEEQRRNGEEPRINIKAEMRRIANIQDPTEMEKRESRIKSMNANADLMKEILMKNAKKRADKKKKRLVPIENRIRDFLTNIDLLKNRDHEFDTGEQPSKDQQRRYILMTKGLKAAVEFSARHDIDEDNPENPV